MCETELGLYDSGPSAIPGSPGSPGSPAAASECDLLINGVWAPVAAALSEKFPGMFSVGIARYLLSGRVDVWRQRES